MYNKKKLTMLDSLRGLASIYVVFNHIFSTSLIIGGLDFSIFFRFGLEAVIIFFLLSGFVIQYSYEQSKDKSFKPFFLKRFMRIYIPLICVYFANYFILLIQKTPVNLSWKLILGNAFMLQDLPYPVKQNVICPPLFNNIPLWSLSYEWWFYMLFFFIKNKLKNKASNFVYLLAILSTVTYLFYPFIINRLFMYLAIWWVGADLARLYIMGTLNFYTLKKQFFTLATCTGLLLYNFLHYGNGINSLRRGGIGLSPFLELRNFAFATIAVYIAVLWKKKHWFGFSKTIGLFLPLAPISFGIYITHWFLIVEAHYFDSFIPNTFIRYIMYFLVCFLFSYLVERVIYIYLSKKLLFYTKYSRN